MKKQNLLLHHLKSQRGRLKNIFFLLMVITYQSCKKDDFYNSSSSAKETQNLQKDSFVINISTKDFFKLPAAIPRCCENGYQSNEESI